MGRWRAVTVLLVSATLLGLLLWYGLTTWLPGIMSAAGYNLGSSLTFQIVLLAGGAIGSLLLAPVYDRAGGHRVVVVVTYLLGAAALVVAISSPAQAPLLVLVFIAGAVAQGGLIMVNGVVDRTYPPELRSAALGATLGYGRIGAIIAPSVLGHTSLGTAQQAASRSSPWRAQARQCSCWQERARRRHTGRGRSRQRVAVDQSSRTEPRYAGGWLVALCGCCRRVTPLTGVAKCRQEITGPQVVGVERGRTSR